MPSTNTGDSNAIDKLTSDKPLTVTREDLVDLLNGDLAREHQVWQSRENFTKGTRYASTWTTRWLFPVT
jgi:hypothetical protein